MSNPDSRVHEIDETDLIHSHEPRQRSARNDPSMRDGNDSRGSPTIEDEDEVTTDNDVGDAAAESASEEAGVMNAVPGQADGGHGEPTLEAAPEDPEAASAADLPTRSRDYESADYHRWESAIETARSGEAPLANYKQLTVPQILEKIESMSPDEMRAVQRYEESHRRRKTLLVRLERRLRGPRPDARTRPDAGEGSKHNRTMSA